MSTEIRVDTLLAEGIALLSSSMEPAQARVEAEILLAEALGKARSWLFAFADAMVGGEPRQRFHRWCEQRASGVPVAYLLGRREFWGLDLMVDRNSLIPRHDTERLVELALEHLDDVRAASVLDLGTGSGAIALAIAHERPRARVTGLDRSERAVSLACRNASALGISNVSFEQSDWFSALDPRARFDLIVSNPPYIAEGDPHLTRGDCRFEPITALVAADAGLADLRRIVTGAPVYLMSGGWLLLEHGWDQAASVRELLAVRGFNAVASWQDLAGVDRVSGGRWDDGLA